ncbi:hypothetical protein GLAREA_05790 [Glarea lozoyensis ATCC 20868]|uniref:Uncharacterized protein n=1 Tax=Glarea lozoyensis (strain ATCC 20868 / MF5171) TaxID=1116229 RepID=S3DDF7_GLAL2|nr:uncharacterized protein GLAREA_05790 [Glarea lozoyensis ATCC 20868]EPE36452.1 hypothetical protein GLAREA_05790 [Glarea lozoyensis ATCC 20868]
MTFLRALYLNFKDDFGDLLETTDFSVATWLALGAGLQLLSQTLMPMNLAFWLPLIYLLQLVIRVWIACRNIFTGSFKGIRFGRWSTQFSEPSEGSKKTATSDGVVMFLLGARINHPLGKLAPGSPEIDKVFKDMWKEAEANSDEWSYLGRSATLFDTSDSQGVTAFWLSYWKDLEGLQKFATSAAHNLGRNAYNAGKYRYMGIFHETYYSPKGCWETIYGNMPPIGLGKIMEKVDMGSEGVGLVETLRKNMKGSTMYSRMGRN